MQVEQKQLEQQQKILKALGFYQGPIDGLWGPDTISAMKKFEQDPSFLPGVPNNGMPFRERSPYPAGIMYDAATGLLHHPALDAPVEEKPKPIDMEQVKQAAANHHKQGNNKNQQAQS